MAKKLNDFSVGSIVNSAVESARMEARAIERASKSKLELWLEDNDRYCRIWGCCMPLTAELFYELNPYRLGKRLTSGETISVNTLISLALKTIDEKAKALKDGHPDTKYYNLTSMALSAVNVRFGYELITEGNAENFLGVCEGVVSDIWKDLDRLNELKRFDEGRPADVSTEDLYAAMDKLHDMVIAEKNKDLNIH